MIGVSKMKVIYNGTDNDLTGQFLSCKMYDAEVSAGGSFYVVFDEGGHRNLEYMDNFDRVDEVKPKTPIGSPEYPKWIRQIAVVNDDTRRTIKKQKAVAKMVLEQLAFLDDNAIVAGGAPRNWEQGKAAVDIDVYFYIDPSRQCGHILRHLIALFGPMNPMGATKVDLGDSTQEERKNCDYDQMDIRWVFEGVIMGEQVQFIVMKEPTFSSVINRFDSSICKIWYNGFRIIPEPDYLLTAETGVIFIKDPEGKQNKHLEKMYRYYATQGYVFTKDAVPSRTSSEAYTRDNATPWKPLKDSSNDIPW